MVDGVSCRSPAGWDRRFASGMGPGSGSVSVGEVMMVASAAGVKHGGGSGVVLRRRRG